MCNSHIDHLQNRPYQKLKVAQKKNSWTKKSLSHQCATFLWIWPLFYNFLFWSVAHQVCHRKLLMQSAITQWFFIRFNTVDISHVNMATLHEKFPQCWIEWKIIELWLIAFTIYGDTPGVPPTKKKSCLKVVKFI